MELSYFISDTAWGWVGILGSARGLLRITLPQPSKQEARHRLGESLSHATWSPHLFNDLAQRLSMYFSDHSVVFPDELDLSTATPFQRQVWEKTRLIPYGETRSYTWVAEQIKKPSAVRAAGQALGKNPLPIIIPCHRVVGAGGSLGGYSGGLEIKRLLLRLEAAASTKVAREVWGQVP